MWSPALTLSTQSKWKRGLFNPVEGFLVGTCTPSLDVLSPELDFNKMTSQKKDENILRTDQLRWRCFSKNESATKEWFYISLNVRTMNNYKGNYMF